MTDADGGVDPAPLIVTATLDASSFARLDALRRAHFPAHRNVLAAHLTLFHRLPGDDPAAIVADLRTEAAGRAPLGGVAGRVRSLGGGVAVDVDCPALLAVRSHLAERWHASLGPQDRSWGRPHVTVQNKVPPDAAQALLAELASTFQPFPVQIEGFGLWRYLGGPWAPVADVAFA